MNLVQLAQSNAILISEKTIRVWDHVVEHKNFAIDVPTIRRRLSLFAAKMPLKQLTKLLLNGGGGVPEKRQLKTKLR